MKVKIGHRYLTYTYLLGRIPVARIYDRTSYGVTYQPQTTQKEDRTFTLSLEGFDGEIQSFESAEQEVKMAAQGKFLHLDLSIAKDEDIREYEVPDNVNTFHP